MKVPKRGLGFRGLGIYECSSLWGVVCVCMECCRLHCLLPRIMPRCTRPLARPKGLRPPKDLYLTSKDLYLSHHPLLCHRPVQLWIIFSHDHCRTAEHNLSVQDGTGAHCACGRLCREPTTKGTGWRGRCGRGRGARAGGGGEETLQNHAPPFPQNCFKKSEAGETVAGEKGGGYTVIALQGSDLDAPASGLGGYVQVYILVQMAVSHGDLLQSFASCCSAIILYLFFRSAWRCQSLHKAAMPQSNHPLLRPLSHHHL